MAVHWNDNIPIYRQLRDQVIDLILLGHVSEGEPLLSVRQVSADYQINHLTVAKAYQMLVDEGLVEKRRGLGMYVLPGAQQMLVKRENEKFIKTELPAFLVRAEGLGLSINDLVRKIEAIGNKKNEGSKV